MNIYSIVAFILAGCVLAYGVSSADGAAYFLNSHAIFIVVGGTIAAASISFQMDRVLLLFRIFFRGVIRGRKQNYSALIEELMILAQERRTGSVDFEKRVQESQDPFLKEAFTVLLDEVLGPQALLRVLRMRVNTIFQEHVEDMLRFRTIGKYPPAFGLMGTTLSMISLLQKLGQPGGQKLIGPSMALGLVATFYGLALANLVFNPISENLHDRAKEIRLKNQIIVEGISLIMKNVNPLELAEELNSYVLAGQRIDWKIAQKAKKAA